jgi:hypothetical protein
MRLYRARKFVGRHRFAVASAAAIVIALVGGLAATLWQAHETELQRARAERRFDEVRKLANSFLFEVHDGIENLPGATPTRQLLVKRALAYFDSLAAEEKDDLRCNGNWRRPTTSLAECSVVPTPEHGRQRSRLASYGARHPRGVSQGAHDRESGWTSGRATSTRPDPPRNVEHRGACLSYQGMTSQGRRDGAGRSSCARLRVPPSRGLTFEQAGR